MRCLSQCGSLFVKCAKDPLTMWTNILNSVVTYSGKEVARAEDRRGLGGGEGGKRSPRGILEGGWGIISAE